MRFTVRHETLYRYCAPVQLGEHLLRMTPRAGQGRMIARTLVIEPEPIWRDEGTDAHGTAVTRLGFEGKTSHFRIESRFELETVAAPLPAAPLPPLPWPPDKAMRAYLGMGEDDSVRAFARDLAAGQDVPGFLDGLNRWLFEQTHRHIRPEGDAQAAAHTLATGSGACRDLTVLFMAACRSQGIPARFVSGYQAKAESVDGKRHLHAWAEVFLPGAGWRGYDPTHGRVVGDGHVALAAAPDQRATMPVEGGFYGPPVRATLSYAMEIEARD